MLEHLRPLNQLWVRDALTKVAKTNTTSAEDNLVTEMLLELDQDVHEEVAPLFRDRMLNQGDSTGNI